MRWPVVFSYARLRPAMVRSFPAPKPSTTVQNNAAGSTCRSRFTAPVERASATRNTAGKSLRRASRIGTAFSRAIGCSSSLGKPEVRSMARPSSQKAAIVAQIVRAGSLNRTPMFHDQPYSFRTRFESEDGKAGTNPEELLGAAHAGCFAMALSFALTDAGHAPT